MSCDGPVNSGASSGLPRSPATKPVNQARFTGAATNQHTERFEGRVTGDSARVHPIEIARRIPARLSRAMPQMLRPATDRCLRSKRARRAAPEVGSFKARAAPAQLIAPGRRCRGSHPISMSSRLYRIRTSGNSRAVHRPRPGADDAHQRAQAHGQRCRGGARRVCEGSTLGAISIGADLARAGQRRRPLPTAG